MKRFRFLMMAAFAVVCASMSAQQVITLDQLKAKKQNKQTQSQSQQKAQPQKQQKSYSSSDYEGFSSFIVQYNASSWKISAEGMSASSGFTGLSAGYLKAINMGNTPFYIEPGVIAQYFFQDKFSMLSAKIPVSAIYTFPIADNINLDPYAGVYLRGNIIGKFDKVDVFSKEEMKKAGQEPWKRVQFGLHFGLRARFNDKFIGGISYSMDLNEITAHTKVNSFDLTFGIIF
ncbi:porin family protein [Prevotella heparinolytica]|uniref:Outer membrane protein beta-barrel domain-containing protein n=1 Tax=Prevotella heparinolytica TaxID=28113 RepID=A0A4R2LNB6_9BACE|nr:hypothetical protein [Bacteroides heparinolyticus]TCO88344.1 hypothetical protein EV202_1264 [Bacteroides heparinolyticus]